MSERPLSNGSNYLTIQDLSAKTGFSVTQLRRLVRAQKIPFYQPGGKGGKLLFPPDAIERCASEDSRPVPDDEPQKPLSGRRPRWMQG